MEPPLAGRLALVTGASRGFGRAIALALAKAGADLAVACREQIGLAQKTAEQIRATGRRASVHAVDLAAPKGPETLVREAIAALGGLDLVVAGAGVTLAKPLLRTTPEEWDAILRLDLTSVAFLCQAAIAPLVSRGGGDLVLVSSHAGTGGRAGLSAYGAAKAGLIGLGRSLARELGPDRIRVHTVLPGFMPTDMGESAGAGPRETARKESALGELSDPARAAGLVAALCAAGQVSGQVWSLDARPAPLPW